MTNLSNSNKPTKPTKPTLSVRLRKVALVGALVASFGLPVTADAATVKSGASCAKAGRTARVGKTSYRCTRSAGKLKWVITKKASAVRDTKAPDTKAPDTKAPDTKAPDTKAPDTKAPDTKAPTSKAPDTKAA